MKKLGLLLLVCLCAGCGTISQWWTDHGQDVTPVVPPIVVTNLPPVVPPVTPPVQAGLWPAYYAPEFLQHGNATENDYRAEAIEQARATGCIRLRAWSIGDELAIHIIDMRHPDRPGYKMGAENWTRRAEARGVRKWQFEMVEGDFDCWQRLLGYCDYTRDTLQIIVPAAMVSEARSTWPQFDVFAEGAQ